MLNRVESKKRMIGPRRGSQTGDGASRDQSSPTRVTSKRNSTGSSAAALTPAPTTGGFSTPMRQASKGTGASSATPAGDAGALLGESQGTLWSRQNSKDGGPQRVSSKLRKLGFKNLEEYEDGELEREFVDRVQQGEDAWVLNCLAAVGRRILFSEWAGGIARTSILYASKQGDQEMCKILLAYGGKELLKVKDLKGRDGEYYAKLHGIDPLRAREWGNRGMSDPNC